MSILGIGIDLADVDRLRRAAERTPGVLQRLFTQEELDYCLAKKHPYEHLASRFAAKEACIKVLGRRIPWHSMEIRRRRSGKPDLVVDPAHLPAGAVAVHLSLTHERTMAAAVVVLERAGPTDPLKIPNIMEPQ